MDKLNNMEVDLSIIVTVYNIENYIGECVDSLLKEKEINIEVILVNDASTDHSLDICKKYAEEDERVKIYNNDKNMGITSSRNNGLRIAKGKYLYVIDGDDVVKDGALSKIYNICSENNLDMLEFSADVFYENEEGKEYVKEDEYIQKYNLNEIKDGPQLLAINQQYPDARWGNCYLRCYRTELLQKNELYFVEKLRYADGSGFHLYLAAKRAMIIDDVFYSRRVREKSQITSGVKFYYLESSIILFMEELKLWEKYKFSDDINRGIEKYFKRTHRQIVDMYQQFKGKKNEYTLLNDHPAARYYYEYNIMNKSLCLDYFSKFEIEEMKNRDFVYVYGAGFYAEELSKVFDYYDIDYKYVVTEMSGNPEILRGKKVYAIHDVDFKKEDMVVIAVAERHQKSIVENLSKHGVTNWKQFIV